MASPLRSVKVLELAGLAPVPMAGMILADFGATVTKVDRPGMSMDRLVRGKRSIVVYLKSPKGVDVVKRLSKSADVLIEPFRPGVMEKLGLGPDDLHKHNEKLIYARLTGFGQHGPLSKEAGHDINYLAISGLLSILGRKGDKPFAPLNFLADFAGGALTCVMGILLALFERSTSGKGQVIDCSMVEGAAYLGSFVNLTRDMSFLWQGERGTNLLDTGAPFYDTYRTKDGEYMACGAIEPAFYQNLVQGLGLAEEFPVNIDTSSWSTMRARFTEVFATKTQKEWVEIFESKNACVTPVLSLDDAASHPHNTKRDSFSRGVHSGGEVWQPNPAPKLSRNKPREVSHPQPQPGQHTVEVLSQEGFSKTEIDSLLDDNIVTQSVPSSSL